MRLDPSLYHEVRRDEQATGQAIAVVLSVAVAHGLADVLRAILLSSQTGDNPATAWLFGVPAEISFWVMASLVIMGVGSLFGARRDYSAVIARSGSLRLRDSSSSSVRLFPPTCPRPSFSPPSSFFGLRQRSWQSARRWVWER
jgi:hypothetical protein